MTFPIGSMIIDQPPIPTILLVYHLAPLGNYMDNTCALLGTTWRPLGTTWELIEHTWAPKGNFGTTLRQPWDNFGTFLRYLYDNFDTTLG